MQIESTSFLTLFRKEQIRALWNKEYPQSLHHGSTKNFEGYLATLDDANHYLLTDADEEIMAWLVCFTREGERWFAMILDASIHCQGWGSKLLQEVKKHEPFLNGWVIDQNIYQKSNGENYRSPLDFYIKNGFEIVPRTRLELNHLSAVKIHWVKEVAMESTV